MTSRTDLAALADLLERIGHYDREQKVIQAAAALLVKLAAEVLRLVPASTPVQQILDPLLRALPTGPATRAELERLARKASSSDAHPWLVGRAYQLAGVLGRLAQEVAALELLSDASRKERLLANLADVAYTLFPDKSQELVVHLIRSQGNRSAEAALVAKLWPEENEEQGEPPHLRNRLHQLQRKTNNKLVLLAWKITRPEPRVLWLRSLKMD